MIRRIHDNLEEILSVVLVAALCIIVTLQVFCRLVIQQPLSWSEEAATILFVWITMIGSSLALKKGEHFAVELLHRKLPPNARRAAAIVVAELVIVFSALLIWQGWDMTVRNVPVITPAMEISRAVPYSAILGGGILMFVRGVEMLVRHLRAREVQS